MKRRKIKRKPTMKFHPYGTTIFVPLPEGSTVQDLRSLAFFNRIVKNYLKMNKIAQNND